MDTRRIDQAIELYQHGDPSGASEIVEFSDTMDEIVRLRAEVQRLGDLAKAERALGLAAVDVRNAKRGSSSWREAFAAFGAASERVNALRGQDEAS